ncbi:hypothetical protein Tco_1008581 [Tanacetum coccineum]
MVLTHCLCCICTLTYKSVRGLRSGFSCGWKCLENKEDQVNKQQISDARAFGERHLENGSKGLLSVSVTYKQTTWEDKGETEGERMFLTRRANKGESLA